MKKIGMLILCLALLATSALAGTEPVELKRLNDTQSLLYTMPEGVANVTVTDEADMKVVVYEMTDASMPDYRLIVSYSDLLGDRDLAELTGEELEAVVAYTAHDSEGYSYEMLDMEDGWPAVLIDYEGESDWVDAFTIISGYLIQLHGNHKDFSPLTDAENMMAFTLLDSVDVVDTEFSGEEDMIAGMPNPMLESDAAGFAALSGLTPALPGDAADVAYFTYSMGLEMAEVQFTSGGVAYTFRAEPSDALEDISGAYNQFADEQAVTVGGADGVLKINDGADGVLLWHNADPAMTFSLYAGEGATADGLTGMAEALIAQP